MLRHQSTAADAELRIFIRRQDPFYDFYAWPHAPRILPTAAGTTEPLPQQGTRQHKPAFAFTQLASQRRRLPGRAHADTDQCREEICRHRQTRALRNIVHAADQLQTAAWAD